MKHTETKQIRAILAGTVQCDMPYPTFLERLQDDTDGETDARHILTVSQGPDGDMYIGVDGRLLRFRAWSGGGMSLATHNAIRVLAEAMRMDNASRPQRQPNNQVQKRRD